MSNYRIAVRYAKSLMELAIDNEKLEEVKEDIDMFYSLCNTNRDFINFLRNPIIHSYKKSGIIKHIFEEKFNELTFRFIEIVTRKGREDVLPDIAGQFLVLYRQHKKIQIVEVVTPGKLDKSLREDFMDFARDYVGKDWKVELNEKVKEDLIGGFVVKIGDKQIDSSVSSKLREIRKKLIVS